MPEAKGETLSFDHLHKALFVEKNADSVLDSPCLESLDWSQCYRETEPHPHVHTELPRGERSPQTAITGEHARVMCHLVIYTACTPRTAWMPWILHRTLLPLYSPATQLRQQSLQTGCTWQAPPPVSQIISSKAFSFQNLFSYFVCSRSQPQWDFWAIWGGNCVCKCVETYDPFLLIIAPYAPPCPIYSSMRSWPNTVGYPGTFWSLCLTTCNTFCFEIM